ncbi:MAG: SUMF1/EgtB/PvdO family nonheme iron enzyme, partial [Gammaproteobacteria bacterium]|nr:SUMF1/EgtB/PvdO family nonheme iron enzyme [Gammaproteobacteria bacterium]
VVVGGFRCPMLFLSLFDEERVEAYLHKRFSDSWYQFTPQRKKTEKKRRNALKILNKMESLRFRPLLLAHIEDLVDAPKQDWDAYRIYAALIDVWLYREERKIRKIHKRAEKLPDKEDLLKACIKVAEFMQRKGTKTLDEDELQNLIAASDGNISYLKDFNMGGRSLLNRNSDRAYRFSHYTIQEFLLARGIVEGTICGEPIRATDQIVWFLDLSGSKGMGLSRLNLEDFKLGQYFRKYKRAGRDFRHVNLIRLDLSDAYLKEADFGWANLENANFEGADLREARFTGTNLNGANLNATGILVRDSLADAGPGPEMITLSAGSFQMGDIQGNGRGNEKPVHEVTLDAFAIGRYPVTFDEYDKFAEATDREKPGDGGWGRGRHPVINVSWEDAAAYCDWLCEQSGCHYRLPAEAEWEYAGRAGTETDYCFGNEKKLLKEYAWFDGNAGKKTHPAGEKKANAFGLYDMYGNVGEWVEDWFGDYSGEAQANPTGPETGSNRVIRSGSWVNTARNCRSALRNRFDPGVRGRRLGFRLARTYVQPFHPFSPPEMARLPGGTFKMGDSKCGPIHKVTLSAFSIGRYPVTFAEYDRFCEAVHRQKPEDRGWGRGGRPVINVSWDDAVAYCEWLSCYVSLYPRTFIPTYSSRNKERIPCYFRIRQIPE